MSVRGWSGVNQSHDKAAGRLDSLQGGYELATSWLRQKKERGRSSDQPLEFLGGP